jgi:hypothetical protein
MDDPTAIVIESVGTVTVIAEALLNSTIVLESPEANV